MPLLEEYYRTRRMLPSSLLFLSLQFPFLLVFTKTDKLSRPKLKKIFSRLESEGNLGGVSYVPFSAENSEGREDVLSWIGDIVNLDKS